MLLYYITDRRQFPGTEQEQRLQLLLRISAAARSDLDYIQLREKDLSTRNLEFLARDALKCVRDNSSKTKLLINSRIDVALAVAADGVHLTSTDISASDARAIISSLNSQRAIPKVIGVSCHSAGEVRLAESHGADFAVLAPIFEKAGTNIPPLGLDALRRATRHSVPPDTRVEAGDQRHHLPVLALGGITLENARQCRAAGAAGIAAIRLFQQRDLKETVRILRAI